MPKYKIITNVFEIQPGDIMQLNEDGKWTDLGVINDKRAAAADLYKNNFIVMDKPARVIRK